MADIQRKDEALTESGMVHIDTNQVIKKSFMRVMYSIFGRNKHTIFARYTGMPTEMLWHVNIYI